MITNEIKKILKGYMEHAELSNMEIAEVVSVKPRVSIKLHELNELIEGDFLVVPKRLVDENYELIATVEGSNAIGITGLTLKHQLVDEGSIGHAGDATAHLTFNNPLGIKIQLKNVTLQPGDKVAVLKSTGGQRYFILEKVIG